MMLMKILMISTKLLLHIYRIMLQNKEFGCDNFRYALYHFANR